MFWYCHIYYKTIKYLIKEWFLINRVMLHEQEKLTNYPSDPFILLKEFILLNYETDTFQSIVNLAQLFFKCYIF